MIELETFGTGKRPLTLEVESEDVASIRIRYKDKSGYEVEHSFDGDEVGLKAAVAVLDSHVIYSFAVEMRRI